MASCCHSKKENFPTQLLNTADDFHFYSRSHAGVYHVTIWKSWMSCLCQSVLQIINLLDHENKTSLFHSFDHLLENVVVVMFAHSNVQRMLLKRELNLQIPRVNHGVLHSDWSLIQNIQTEKAVYMLSSKCRILSQCGHCLYSWQDLMSCCFTFMSY